MNTKPLNNLWNFVLDNPEISIFIATAVFGALTWFVQKSFKPTKRWIGKIWKKLTAIVKPLPQKNWFFVNVGEHRGHLKWEDCVRYSCISAGGGPQFAKALQRLKRGDTVYAYISRSGYVGGGKVSRAAVPIHEFTTGSHNIPLPKRDLATSEINNKPDSPDFTDWVAGIEWFKTFEREQASRATEHYLATLCEIQDSGRLASLRKTFGT